MKKRTATIIVVLMLATQTIMASCAVIAAIATH